MMITITTSGGIGGFGLARSAEVAVETLPEPLRHEACVLLDPETLQALAAEPPCGADRIVYHIVVVDEGVRAGAFDVPESALPDETLDLIDALLQRGR